MTNLISNVFMYCLKCICYLKTKYKYCIYFIRKGYFFQKPFLKVKLAKKLFFQKLFLKMKLNFFRQIRSSSIFDLLSTT